MLGGLACSGGPRAGKRNDYDVGGLAVVGPNWSTGLARRGLEEASRTSEKGLLSCWTSLLHPCSILARSPVQPCEQSCCPPPPPSLFSLLLARNASSCEQPWSITWCAPLLLSRPCPPLPSVGFSSCATFVFGLRCPVQYMLSVRTYVRRGTALMPRFFG